MLLIRLIFATAMAGALSAQPLAVSGSQLRIDWRPVGNQLLDAGLAGLASGPIERVWFAPDGLHLYVQAGPGRIFKTEDFETWHEVKASAPARMVEAEASPESRRLGEFRGRSLLGGDPADVAVSPLDGDDIVVGNRFGVWRSLDGGASWDSLNVGLPNLNVARIVKPVAGLHGTRIVLKESNLEAYWRPGERNAWRVSEATLAARNGALAQVIGPVVGFEPAAIEVAGDWIAAGGAGGALALSPDQGESWRTFVLPGGGTVRSLWLAEGGRIALAALDGVRGARLARTMNGGIFWDDVTGDLESGLVHGVTADLEAGAVYVASEAGLFSANADLRGAGPAFTWSRVETGNRRLAVDDVTLDAEGHQLLIAVRGLGVLRGIAPHRFRDPRVVNAADGSSRPAAPGSLLSVLGARGSSAAVGGVDVPVLDATDVETQVQVPFAVTGSSLTLALRSSGGVRNWAVPLRATSPAIFADRDGTPIILDAERAVLLDAGNPARAGSLIQILATGLGKVTPDWPAGIAAPLEGPPRVDAPVRVWFDRIPLEVTRATLAPGYVGFYLIEARLPDLVNAGPAEVYLEAGGAASGRVSLHVAP